MVKQQIKIRDRDVVFLQFPRGPARVAVRCDVMVRTTVVWLRAFVEGSVTFDDRWTLAKSNNPHRAYHAIRKLKIDEQAEIACGPAFVRIIPRLITAQSLTVATFETRPESLTSIVDCMGYDWRAKRVAWVRDCRGHKHNLPALDFGAH